MFKVSDESKKRIGQFFKDGRVNAGLSQMEVARHFGYKSVQNLSNWERGSSTPPTKVVKTLLRIYNLKPQDYVAILKVESSISIESWLMKSDKKNAA